MTLWNIHILCNLLLVILQILVWQLQIVLTYWGVMIRQRCMYKINIQNVIQLLSILNSQLLAQKPLLFASALCAFQAVSEV